MLGADRAFLVALARAFAGAVLFGLPLLVTMEMWSAAFAVDPLRLALFLLLGVPLLTGLAHYVGFREDQTWLDSLYDALVAFLVAACAVAAVLAAIGVLGPDTGWRDAIGKIAVQLIPAGIGATVARGQLGMQAEEESGSGEAERDSLPGELFLMVAGALFFALNIAPTDEVGIIARQISPWHAILLVLATVLAMHALVYGLRFRGQHQPRLPESPLVEFVALTVIGYLLALSTCACLLWILGRLDGLSGTEVMMMIVILGLPAGLGAATARVVL
jgi:putative integral membrane protein (TIGR02587 family)